MRAPICAVALLALASAANAAPAPHLRAQGTTEQLIVDGKPFLILGGELGNSTASDLSYLKPHWSKFKALGLNTVLAPIYWELVEPQEGRFDFSSLEGLIRDARAADQRLVLLWFGSWKNSMSSYAPAWVKRDQARFPRVPLPDGKGQEILSAFGSQSREVDARAFRALMSHLKQIDGERRTVIMIQVENEIGMLPTPRELGPAAEAAWRGPVPPTLLRHLSANRTGLTPELKALWEARGARTSGTWAEVFGSSPAAEEVFTAWHYAVYTDAVARAGKQAYELPMFVNAALNRPGRKPGEYPSGGPLGHLLDVWEAGAPTIDFASPDIYFENFAELIARFERPGNPLFIPEANQAGRADTPADAFFAIGEHDAMGFSPFSIESIDDPATHRLTQAYAILRQLTPVILEHQGKGRSAGFRPTVAYDGTVDEAPRTVVLGDWRLTAAFVDPWTPKDKQQPRNHGGLVIQLGPDEYLIAGSGLTVTFASTNPGVQAGIESIYEGRYENGRWIPGRLLNGDQSHQGRHLRLPPESFGVQRVRLYGYR